jgi:hypothetical protein
MNKTWDKGLAIANGASAFPFSHPGGMVVLMGGGTFGGGNVALQFCTDADVSWFDVGPQNAVPTAVSAAGSSAFYLPPGRYRVNVAGATAPSLAWSISDANP